MAESKKPVKKTAAKAAAPKAKAAKAAAAPQKPVKKAVARPVTRVATPKPAARAEKKAPEPKPAERKPKAEPRPLPTAPAGHAPVVGADGSASGSVLLPALLAKSETRDQVVFQAFLAGRANARQATAATKNRSRVAGGGAKPWRQKGTGRARQGSTRSPQWRHGAVVFGPNGRQYGQRIPEKMRRAAFARAFADRVSAGRVVVYDAMPDGDAPKTRAFREWLGKIGDTGRTVVVAERIVENQGRAIANLPAVSLRSTGSLQLADLLTAETVLVSRGALDALAQRAGAVTA
ncbi:MAG TPA: 50S ribosomal protein L4 [Candidatus Limnocylindria bacterium]|nr:50S ribosomal protein L4 [Candidatus Limnocylindria bacterium]